jgi:ATP-dependent protease HslVU (ClpYQ) peptidase subunit
VTKSLRIAGEICIYTNHNVAIEELDIPADTAASA